VEAVRAVLFIVAVCSVGCVESRFDELPPVQQNFAMQPPIDTFWLQQSIAAMREPPRLPVRSISLGYIGDAPLSGGVMRDTPMPQPQMQMEPEPQTCACAMRNQ
jgi:hypothetical protein